MKLHWREFSPNYFPARIHRHANIPYSVAAPEWWDKSIEPAHSYILGPESELQAWSCFLLGYELASFLVSISVGPAFPIL
jgi:hypothetical protein